MMLNCAEKSLIAIKYSQTVVLFCRKVVFCTLLDDLQTL